MANKGSITRLRSVETLKNAVDSLLVGNRLSLQQEEFLLSSLIGLFCRTPLKPRIMSHFTILRFLSVCIRFAMQLH